MLQLFGFSTFMFINGLIGGGYPFANLVVFALFGLINKKLGILFFILTVIAGFGEFIMRIMIGLAGGWASGMGARGVNSGIDAWIMYTYGLINGLLCAIAFYWVWKTVGKFWPDFGRWSLCPGIVMYVLGLFCAVFVLPRAGVSFITTLIGIVMLVVALKTPFSLVISGLSICVIAGGFVIFSLKNPEAAQEVFPIEAVEDIVEDVPDIISDSISIVSEKLRWRSRLLLDASFDGNLKRVKLALTLGADVNSVDGEFGLYTALMWASVKGHTEIVKLLLAKGADVNIKDREGRTALDFAYKNGNTEIIELLKSAGEKE